MCHCTCFEVIFSVFINLKILFYNEVYLSFISTKDTKSSNLKKKKKIKKHIRASTLHQEYDKKIKFMLNKLKNMNNNVVVVINNITALLTEV